MGILRNEKQWIMMPKNHQSQWCCGEDDAITFAVPDENGIFIVPDGIKRIGKNIFDVSDEQIEDLKEFLTIKHGLKYFNEMVDSVIFRSAHMIIMPENKLVDVDREAFDNEMSDMKYLLKKEGCFVLTDDEFADNDKLHVLGHGGIVSKVVTGRKKFEEFLDEEHEMQ